MSLRLFNAYDCEARFCESDKNSNARESSQHMITTSVIHAEKQSHVMTNQLAWSFIRLSGKPSSDRPRVRNASLRELWACHTSLPIARNSRCWDAQRRRNRGEIIIKLHQHQLSHPARAGSATSLWGEAWSYGITSHSVWKNSKGLICNRWQHNKPACKLLLTEHKGQQPLR